MLRTRIITAAVMLPIALYIILFSPYKVFFAFVTACYFVAVWEWSHFVTAENLLLKSLFRFFMLLMLFLIYKALNTHQHHVIYVFEHQAFSLAAFYALIVLTVGLVGLVVSTYFVCTYPRTAKCWNHPIGKSLCALWTLLPWWLSMIVLHQSVLGVWGLLFAGIIVWSADSGAYFAGRRFGKRKLAEAVSPGKTIEGVLGGVLTSCVIAGGLGLWVLSHAAHSTHIVLTPLSIIALFVMIILLSVVSVVGDLAESMFKRAANLKDSGKILPGHGGLLDRIDGLTFALPLFAWMLVWFNLALT